MKALTDKPNALTTGQPSRLRAYAELSKLRISIMVLATFVVAGMLAAGGSTNVLLLLNATIGMLLFSASGNAMNMYIERYTDFLMPRTAKRPLPDQRLAANEVVLFASICFGVGLGFFATAVNWQVTLCAVATWILYVAVYTPLKTRTPLNTEVGAVAGALPVIMGALATTGTVDLVALSLFGVVYLWQFPHFMAIAWLYRDEYRDGGMQMLTVVDPSGRRAGIKSVVCSVLLIVVSAVPAITMERSTNAYVFAAISLLIGAIYLWASLRFCANRTDWIARGLLRVSLIYLPVYLLVLLIACLS